MKHESLLQNIVHQTFAFVTLLLLVIVLLPAAFIIIPLWFIYNALFGKENGVTENAPKL